MPKLKSVRCSRSARAGGLAGLQDEGSRAIRQRSAKQKIRTAKKSWHAQNLHLLQSSLNIEADGDAVKIDPVPPPSESRDPRSRV
ncbi:uncharacterized protein TrAtP1_001820 [Trichoderma atroviride]|uniref:uncharacterized protein n=1 Tax=Hypocrea atroviridis TaxID=63577 RepID=UPI00333155BD|nr:hypothetical protein TrAtP1_001820 [Trichoderma atroviride]